MSGWATIDDETLQSEKASSGAATETNEAIESRFQNAFLNVLSLRSQSDSEAAYKGILKDATLPPTSRIRYLCLKNLAALEIEGNSEAALDHLVQATAIEDSDISLWLQVATLSLNLRRYRLARYAAESIIRQKGTHIAALRLLLLAVQKIGDAASIADVCDQLRLVDAWDIVRPVARPSQEASLHTTSSDPQPLHLTSPSSSSAVEGVLEVPSWKSLGEVLLSIFRTLISERQAEKSLVSPVSISLGTGLVTVPPRRKIVLEPESMSVEVEEIEENEATDVTSTSGGKKRAAANPTRASSRLQQLKVEGVADTENIDVTTLFLRSIVEEDVPPALPQWWKHAQVPLSTSSPAKLKGRQEKSGNRDSVRGAEGTINGDDVPPDMSGVDSETQAAMRHLPRWMHIHGSECATCGEGGYLLCCDFCPVVYHPDTVCLPPGVDKSVEILACSDCRKEASQAAEAAAVDHAFAQLKSGEMRALANVLAPYLDHEEAAGPPILCLMKSYLEALAVADASELQFEGSGSSTVLERCKVAIQVEDALRSCGATEPYGHGYSDISRSNLTDDTQLSRRSVARTLMLAEMYLTVAQSLARPETTITTGASGSRSIDNSDTTAAFHDLLTEVDMAVAPFLAQLKQPASTELDTGADAIDEVLSREQKIRLWWLLAQRQKLAGQALASASCLHNAITLFQEADNAGNTTDLSSPGRSTSLSVDLCHWAPPLRLDAATLKLAVRELEATAEGHIAKDTYAEAIKTLADSKASPAALAGARKSLLNTLVAMRARYLTNGTLLPSAADELLIDLLQQPHIISAVSTSMSAGRLTAASLVGNGKEAAVPIFAVLVGPALLLKRRWWQTALSVVTACLERLIGVLQGTVDSNSLANAVGAKIGSVSTNPRALSLLDSLATWLQASVTAAIEEQETPADRESLTPTDENSDSEVIDEGGTAQGAILLKKAQAVAAQLVLMSTHNSRVPLLEAGIHCSRSLGSVVSGSGYDSAVFRACCAAVGFSFRAGRNRRSTAIYTSLALVEMTELLKGAEKLEGIWLTAAELTQVTGWVTQILQSPGTLPALVDAAIDCLTMLVLSDRCESTAATSVMCRITAVEALHALLANSALCCSGNFLKWSVGYLTSASVKSAVESAESVSQSATTKEAAAVDSMQVDKDVGTRDLIDVTQEGAGSGAIDMSQMTVDESLSQGDEEPPLPKMLTKALLQCHRCLYGVAVLPGAEVHKKAVNVSATTTSPSTSEAGALYMQWEQWFDVSHSRRLAVRRLLQTVHSCPTFSKPPETPIGAAFEAYLFSPCKPQSFREAEGDSGSMMDDAELVPQSLEIILQVVLVEHTPIVSSLGEQEKETVQQLQTVAAAEAPLPADLVPYRRVFTGLYRRLADGAPKDDAIDALTPTEAENTIQSMALWNLYDARYSPWRLEAWKGLSEAAVSLFHFYLDVFPATCHTSWSVSPSQSDACAKAAMLIPPCSALSIVLHSSLLEDAQRVTVLGPQVLEGVTGKAERRDKTQHITICAALRLAERCLALRASVVEAAAKQQGGEASTLMLAECCEREGLHSYVVARDLLGHLSYTSDARPVRWAAQARERELRRSFDLLTKCLHLHRSAGKKVPWHIPFLIGKLNLKLGRSLQTALPLLAEAAKLAASSTAGGVDGDSDGEVDSEALLLTQHRLHATRAKLVLPRDDKDSSPEAIALLDQLELYTWTATVEKEDESCEVVSDNLSQPSAPSAAQEHNTISARRDRILVNCLAALEDCTRRDKRFGRALYTSAVIVKSLGYRPNQDVDTCLSPAASAVSLMKPLFDRRHEVMDYVGRGGGGDGPLEQLERQSRKRDVVRRKYVAFYISVLLESNNFSGIAETLAWGKAAGREPHFSSWVITQATNYMARAAQAALDLLVPSTNEVQPLFYIDVCGAQADETSKEMQDVCGAQADETSKEMQVLSNCWDAYLAALDLGTTAEPGVLRSAEQLLIKAHKLYAASISMYGDNEAAASSSGNEVAEDPLQHASQCCHTLWPGKHGKGKQAKSKLRLKRPAAAARSRSEETSQSNKKQKSEGRGSSRESAARAAGAGSKRRREESVEARAADDAVSSQANDSDRVVMRLEV